MRIILNGDTLNTDAATILALLNAMKIDPDRVAVERNLNIVPRSEYASSPLNSEDSIEIVHFVGGG